MKRAILATLANGPATLGDLQRALGVPSSPAHRRGVLLNRLKALAAAGQVRGPTLHDPKWELPGLRTRASYGDRRALDKP